MHYVYILKSLKSHKLYYGFTSDLIRRISEHNAGKNISTKPYIPYELVYYEAYKNKQDAEDRERQLKKFGQGIYRLKGRLKRSLQDQSKSM